MPASLMLAFAFLAHLGDAEPPAGGVLEGRVVDAQGNPVAGAIIRIDPEIPVGDNEEIEDLDVFWEEFESAEDGAFRIPGLRRGGRYDATINHPRYVERTLWSVEAPTPEPVQIVLQAGRSLTGRVVGPKGEAVAGARLNALEEHSMGGAGSRSGHSIAATDQEGRFQAYGLPPGYLTIEVTAAGYSFHRIENLHIPDGQDLQDLRIALDPGAQLDIQVLNARGEPVPETEVYAEPESGSRSSLSLPHDARCETDSQGRCRISVPQPGWYKARVMRGGFQGAEAAVRVQAAGGTTPVEIRLPAGVEVSGRVLGEDGEPARRAEILLDGGGGSVEPDGSFRFFNVADGQYLLTARLRQPKESSSATTLEIQVAGQPLQGIELRLQKAEGGTLLTGRLLGLEPGELRNAFLMAHSEPLPATGDNAKMSQPDAQGEYRLKDLGPGDWTVFAQTPTGRTTSATVRIEPGAKTASLDLRFSPRGPRVSGRVLVNGSPLPRAGIQAWRDFQAAGQSGTTDDGTFVFDLQEPGAITLLVGGPQGIGASWPIQVTADSEITVEIQTGRLCGTVIGPTGEPVKDATITIQGWSRETQVSLWEMNLRGGSFEVPRVGVGLVRISVQAPGFAASETLAEVPPGGEGVVEIRLGSLDQR